MTAEKDDEVAVSSINDSGMFLLMGEITIDSVKPVIEWILQSNYVTRRKKKELLLMICSEGGDMSAAFALIDVMMSSPTPIKTVGLGQIASAALLIFISGAPGRRVLTPNTSILSHQFTWESDGKAHELFARIKEFDLTQTRMLNHYQQCTGMSEDDIRTYLLPPQDIWLSAEEAQKFNITDHVSVFAR
jgi:ATP-dependent Clp protease protease subunit